MTEIYKIQFDLSSFSVMLMFPSEARNKVIFKINNKKLFMTT